MELFNEAITWVNSIVWSNVLVVICLVAGIYFSARLKFPQIRMFKEMIRLLLKADPNSQSGITPFQAFATTVGSRVGMGSVAGVATGIYFGGPGAVFWMWVLGLLGAGTALMESTLAQAYKTKINGEYIGGPALFIERGLGIKVYAVLFALATILGPDILIQVSAINAALNSFNKVLLAEHIRSCVPDDIREGKDETIDELVGVLQKLMK